MRTTRNIRYRRLGATVVLGLPLLSGCAVNRSADESVTSPMHGTLVLPPAKLATHWDVPPYEDTWDWGWEHYRNDAALGIGGSDGLVDVWHVEVRGVDRRSTQNGRVRESSRTTTRTLRRGLLFTP